MRYVKYLNSILTKKVIDVIQKKKKLYVILDLNILIYKSVKLNIFNYLIFKFNEICEIEFKD